MFQKRTIGISGSGILQAGCPSCITQSTVDLLVIIFRVSRRRREMYCGHARLCVCLCVSVCLTGAACLHYCTDLDVTWGSGRGCPLVVHYWADLQSVHGLRCYGNTRNAWQSPAVMRQAHRTHYARRRRLPSPVVKSTRLLRARRYLQRGRSISSILGVL